MDDIVCEKSALAIKHCWCHFSGTLLVENSLTTSLSMVVRRLRFVDDVFG